MIRPLVIFIAFSTVLAQHDFSGSKLSVLRWCTTSTEEKYKCQNFSRAVERDKGMFDDYYLDVQCHLEYSTDDCISSIDQSRADLMSLDAGEVFIAGRYFSLVPIMQEVIEDGLTNNYAVAVVKKNTLSDVYHIRDLRNKKACFPYVGSQAGWNIPIYTLITEGNMKIVDCNNHVKTAIEFFGPSCAVNSLINKYNPIGDNSDKLCQICTGKVPGGKCTPTDPYYGFEGAFKCLLEEGEVAFLKHTTVLEMINSKRYSGVSLTDFELLCKNGQRAPVEDYIQCNWGLVPTNALVTSSAQSLENRKHFQNFMTTALKYYAKRKFQSYNTTTESSRFGSNVNNNFGNRNTPNSFYNNNNNNYDDFSSRRNFNNNNNNNNEFYDQNGLDDRKNYNDSQFYENFDLFVSDRYGTRLNLMFQDASNSLKGIEEINQNFKSYLGQHEKIIYDIRQCPVERMSLCVTSDAEYEKCVKMRTALKAQLIKPEMICYKAHSHINCMQSIQSGVADVAVFDASDVYTAGLRYDLIPFISEVYNLGLPEYYVVAVAKVEDPDTELTYLKNKYTCHSGINTAAGWVYPLAYLISNGWMRPYGCDSMRAAAEYFTKSCVPGAISTEYNTGVPYDNMCDLCRGASYRYCRRDASEDYYGHTGAFRCLVEGGGHVAFVKHTTVFESTGGKRKEWWARDALEDDFELLCADGTRAKTTEYQTCNLGRVKSNAIVTRGGESYNEQEVNAYINLFIYAQQFYGRKDQDDFSFSMFYSHSPYHDLIFQDSTRQLQVIDRSKRRWDLYLGSDFLRARRITDCDSHAIKVHFSIALVLIVSALHFTFYY